jgi:hypothetical protein
LEPSPPSATTTASYRTDGRLDAHVDRKRVAARRGDVTELRADEPRDRAGVRKPLRE